MNTIDWLSVSYLAPSILGFPGGSDGKESACNAIDLGSIPGWGRSPGEGNGNPPPVLLSGDSCGQRSLEGLQSVVAESDTRLSY